MVWYGATLFQRVGLAVSSPTRIDSIELAQCNPVPYCSKPLCRGSSCRWSANTMTYRPRCDESNEMLSSASVKSVSMYVTWHAAVALYLHTAIRFLLSLSTHTHLVDPNIDDEEVDKILESGAEGLFSGKRVSISIFPCRLAWSMLTASQLAEAEQALSDIKDRHEEILKLERSLKVKYHTAAYDNINTILFNRNCTRCSSTSRFWWSRRVSHTSDMKLQIDPPLIPSSQWLYWCSIY